MKPYSSFVSVLVLSVAVGCADDVTDSRLKPGIGSSTAEATSDVPEDSPKPFEFNPDYKRRDFILGIDVDWDSDTRGGIERFDLLEVGMLEKLFNERFIDPNDRQNESPTMQQFFDFAKRQPKVLAYGYAVSPKRDDYRVTSEGIWVPEADVTRQLKKEFIDFCGGADELETDRELSAWWD